RVWYPCDSPECVGGGWARFRMVAGARKVKGKPSSTTPFHPGSAVGGGGGPGGVVKWCTRPSGAPTRFRARPVAVRPVVCSNGARGWTARAPVPALSPPCPDEPPEGPSDGMRHGGGPASGHGQRTHALRPEQPPARPRVP